MNWKKTRLSINRWETCGFRITETPELDGRPFTLECLNDESEPTGFATLRDAQTHADLLNALAVVRDENERMRLELGERRQADAFQPSVRKPDDGHAIPTDQPAVAAIAAELNAVMADNEAAAGEGAEACCADIANGPRLAYAREHEYPF